MLILGQPQVETGVLGDQVLQTLVTFKDQEEQIRFLRLVVEAFCGDHELVSLARDIVFNQYGCQARDKRAQAIAIGTWWQRNIGYVEEIPERFQAPTSTILQRYGDCDDFAQGIAAMLQAIGIESELVAMQWGESDGTYYRHIFTRAVFREGGAEVKLPLDATSLRKVSDLVDPIEVAIDSGLAPLRLYIA